MSISVCRKRNPFILVFAQFSNSAKMDNLYYTQRTSAFFASDFFYYGGSLFTKPSEPFVCLASGNCTVAIVVRSVMQSMLLQKELYNVSYVVRITVTQQIPYSAGCFIIVSEVQHINMIILFRRTAYEIMSFRIDANSVHWLLLSCLSVLLKTKPTGIFTSI